MTDLHEAPFSAFTTDGHWPSWSPFADRTAGTGATAAGSADAAQSEPDADARDLLFLCDHAANAVPPELAGLGLPPGQLDRHIGYDIGAAGVTHALATHFRAPALLAGFSRLLIDPNRGLDDPTLIMRFSDGAVIPANRMLSPAERAERIARFYDPYDTAIHTHIEASLVRGIRPVLVGVHSFTPSWRGAARPWHIGIAWTDDNDLARAFLARLHREPDLVVGDNEPYVGEYDGDTLNRHATRRGLPRLLIEVRQDLITAPD
ncbi:MAG: N-formylglutamate amidohydrolase, partial [Pseudomonadota bacterium]